MLFEAIMLGAGLHLGKGLVKGGALVGGVAALKATGKAAAFANRKAPLLTRIGIGFGAGYALDKALTPLSNYASESYLSIHGVNDRTMSIANKFEATKTALSYGASLAVSLPGGVKGKLAKGKMNPTNRSFIGPKSLLQSQQQLIAHQRRLLKSDLNKIKNKGKPWRSKHPFMASFAIGGAAGAGAGYALGKKMSHTFAGSEGTITAIRSSPQGGMSPELQFSTNGLPLRLHSQSKSRGM